MVTRIDGEKNKNYVTVMSESKLSLGNNFTKHKQATPVILSRVLINNAICSLIFKAKYRRYIILPQAKKIIWSLQDYWDFSGHYQAAWKKKKKPLFCWSSFSLRADSSTMCLPLVEFPICPHKQINYF